MKSPSALRIRRSIGELQHAYEQGNKKPLEDLMRAWKGIKELKYDDPRSFFTLAGYHGEPFRGAGYGSNAFWGGYCNHGNVLFPTWHRVYCLKVEEALQSIPGCADVMLPYWDETLKIRDKETEELRYQEVPWAFTRKTFELDGEVIDNPLRSFKMPIAIFDNVSNDTTNSSDVAGLYGKYQGYETVRYPYSGLVGTDDAKADSEAHNARFSDEQAVDLLNQNVLAWLNGTVVIADKSFKEENGVGAQYAKCLDAPNYTLFSNTTSAQEWNQASQANKGQTDVVVPVVVPLEEPHNHIHLSLGGIDLPTYDRAPIAGANGDMGENDTAAMDPIFFFHHCNVDRVFWLWQNKHKGYTDRLDIIAEYPGTNSSDNQGATAGVAPNMWLTLETPLTPFKKREGNEERMYTSLDCVNIEKQMGYTYSAGSLEADDHLLATVAATPASTRVLSVSRINKAPIKGSFVVAAYWLGAGGKKQLIGVKAVLNRWDSGFCANCQTHLEVKAAFPVPEALASLVEASGSKNGAEHFAIEIIGRDHNSAQLAALTQKKQHRVELL